MKRLGGLALILMLMLWAMPAGAHTRSESQSSWRTAGTQVIGVLQVDAHRATQLARSPADLDDLVSVLARHLAEEVRARQDGQPCESAGPRRLAAEPGQLRVELAYTCRASLATSAAEIEIAAFRAVSPGHVHYARIEQPGGEAHEAVVAGARTSLRIGGTGSATADSFSALVMIGLEHVLSGLDHMAFLLALVLLAGGPWRAALAATGFTLGHSLTLGLVTFGWLKPHTAAIEALIGLTIAFTAALVPTGMPPWPPRARLAWLLAVCGAVAALPLMAGMLGQSAPPWPVYAGAAVFILGFAGRGTGEATSSLLAALLAMAFGLVHGAGFAGGLIELELPKDRLLIALLAFNVGVELAQLAVLGVCAVLAVGLRRLPSRWPALGREAASSALVGLGTYWLVARSFL